MAKEKTVFNMRTLAMLGSAYVLAFASTSQARYRDGMNLYQYVQSAPPARVDPDGLWGEDVHQVLTRDMGAVACPKVAEQIAKANRGLDQGWHGAPEIVILGLLTLGTSTSRAAAQEDYNYHMPGAGPPFPGQKPVVQGFENAVVQKLYTEILLQPSSPKYCNPGQFGKFLHMLQDSWSHGGPPPKGAYKGAVPDFFGHPKGVTMVDVQGKRKTSPGLVPIPVNVDDVNDNYQSYLYMKRDTAFAIASFYVLCPCACQGQTGDVRWGQLRSLGTVIPATGQAGRMYLRMLALDSPDLKLKKIK